MEKDDYNSRNGKNSVRAKSKDSLLEIQLFNGGLLEIESPGVVCIKVDRITPNSEFAAPEGVVYRIETYISKPDAKKPLPGAIYINYKGEYLLPGGENLNERAKKAKR